MEDVTKISPNCDYDEENCIAVFTGKNNRWIDLPGVKGDILSTPILSMEILKSNIVLKVAIRYKDADGKTVQADAATLYGQMGKEITSKKDIKLNLLTASNGKITEEMLKNVVSLRLAMGKAVNEDAPWNIQFGKVILR